MRKYMLIILIILCPLAGSAQQRDVEKKKQKALKASDNLVADANDELSENKFIDAEVTYRKAIAKSGENANAKYNLGNAYYENNSYGEAFTRYKQAGEVAQTKTQKHKAYHNIGNVFMNEKAYEKAVEAYKEALRNNPEDDETRYNLALAKEMLKKQQQQNKNQDQNKDQKDKDQKKDDKKDEKDKEENKDKKEGDKKDKQPQEDKEGEKKKDEKEKQEQKEGAPKDEKGQPKPRPGQLSPQQIKNILEAMSNEEKKVQEKLNTKKVKGRPRRNEKDW